MEPELCFESINGSCVKTTRHLAVRLSLYLVLGATILLTVFGNLLVCMSIIYFKQLQTPTNFLILSLGMSDLLLGLLVMLPSMTQVVESCWYFGNFFLDRHYAVCHPLMYRRKITLSVVLLMILIAWSVSALTGFGMIFMELNIWGIEDFYYSHVACVGGCVLFQSGLSSTLSSLLSFYIPGVIMLGVYLKIFLVARKQLRTIHNINTTRASNSSQTKATKTLAIIMGAFLCFWTPFFVVNVADPFVGYATPVELFEMLVWVGFINSTINPFIYAFFYSWFRKAIRLFLSGDVFIANLSDITLFKE
ncbi:trace amine-associated receptor 1-like [Synchiropus splendidus]|uniref:trace amine-associated receptor 1-like n=1 Tax=Synchiropus splendidus TaxID=270530 RepID=UPI00237E9E4C|nr:trace amine-associated receptor 1-like [Synchiropus splendidus]